MNRSLKVYCGFIIFCSFLLGIGVFAFLKIDIFNQTYSSNITPEMAKLFNFRYYKDLETKVKGQGLLMTLKTNNLEIQTKHHRTFWINKNDFKGYFFIKSFYYQKQDFELFIALNYDENYFQIEKNKISLHSYKFCLKKFEHIVLPVRIKGFKIGTNDLIIIVKKKSRKSPKRIHALRITIVLEKEMKPKIVTLITTLSNKSGTFFKKVQNKTNNPNNKNKTLVRIDKNHFKDDQIQFFCLLGVDQNAASDKKIINYGFFHTKKSIGNYNSIQFDLGKSKHQVDNDSILLFVPNPYMIFEKKSGNIIRKSSTLTRIYFKR